MKELTIYSVTISTDNNYRIYIHKNWYKLPQNQAYELLKIIREDIDEKYYEWSKENESSNND